METRIILLQIAAAFFLMFLFVYNIRIARKNPSTNKKKLAVSIPSFLLGVGIFMNELPYLLEPSGGGISFVVLIALLAFAVFTVGASFTVVLYTLYIVCMYCKTFYGKSFLRDEKQVRKYVSKLHENIVEFDIVDLFVTPNDEYYWEVAGKKDSKDFNLRLNLNGYIYDSSVEGARGCVVGDVIKVGDMKAIFRIKRGHKQPKIYPTWKS